MNGLKLKLKGSQGRIQKNKKWGAGTPILEREGRKTVFERSIQCFSHKSFVKFSGIGGRGAPPPKFAHGS